MKVKTMTKEQQNDRLEKNKFFSKDNNV